jgi:hypothetical protein
VGGGRLKKEQTRKAAKAQRTQRETLLIRFSWRALRFCGFARGFQLLR